MTTSALKPPFPKRVRLCVTVNTLTLATLARFTTRYAKSRSALIDDAVKLLAKYPPQ